MSANLMYKESISGNDDSATEQDLELKLFRFNITNKTIHTCFLRDVELPLGSWSTIKPYYRIDHTTGTFYVESDAGTKGSIKYYMAFIGHFRLSWNFDYTGKGDAEVTKIDESNFYETLLKVDGTVVNLELIQNKFNTKFE